MASVHGPKVAHDQRPEGNLGGRPVGERTAGQNLVVDAQLILIEAEAAVQRIFEDVETEIAAAARRAQARVNLVRINARDRASAIFRGAA